MSVLGALEQLVRDTAAELLRMIADLEKRVAALEDRLSSPPAAAKATSYDKPGNPAAKKATTARAAAATGKGTANG